MTNQHGQKTAVQKFLTKHFLVSKRQKNLLIQQVFLWLFFCGYFFVVNSGLFYQLDGTVGSDRNGAIARLEVLVSDFGTAGF